MFATGRPRARSRADADDEGGADLVVANGGASFLSVLMNCTVFGILGDLDGDCTVGAADLAILFGNWG